MKFAIIGSQKITAQLVRSTIKHGYMPHLIITVNEGNSDKVTDYVSLANLFGDEIKVIETSELSLKNLTNTDKNYLSECDFGLVYGWPRLIPAEILELPDMGIFGVHGGPYEAPRCRGRAVFNWALIYGEENFFMYLFKLTQGADEGAIFKQINFSIERDEDILSIYLKSSYFVEQLFKEFLGEVSSDNIKLIEQHGNNATYLPGRKPVHGGINWSQSADSIVRFIRAQTKPFPGAFSMMDGVRVKIWRAQVFDRGHVLDGKPGEIIHSFSGNEFLVRSGNGIGVLIREFEVQGDWLPCQGENFDLVSGEAQPEVKM